MKKTITLFILSIGILISSAQENVILTIEDENILAEEFLTIYNKNRNIGEEVDPRSIEEYMELFINFKLKVKEAEMRKLLDDLSRDRRSQSISSELFYKIIES